MDRETGFAQKIDGYINGTGADNFLLYLPSYLRWEVVEFLESRLHRHASELLKARGFQELAIFAKNRVDDLSWILPGTGLCVLWSRVHDVFSLDDARLLNKSGLITSGFDGESDKQFTCYSFSDDALSIERPGFRQSTLTAEHESNSDGPTVESCIKTYLHCTNQNPEQTTRPPFDSLNAIRHAAKKTREREARSWPSQEEGSFFMGPWQEPLVGVSDLYPYQISVVSNRGLGRRFEKVRTAGDRPGEVRCKSPVAREIPENGMGGTTRVDDESGTEGTDHEGEWATAISSSVGVLEPSPASQSIHTTANTNASKPSSQSFEAAEDGIASMEKVKALFPNVDDVYESLESIWNGYPRQEHDSENGRHQERPSMVRPSLGFSRSVRSTQKPVVASKEPSSEVLGVPTMSKLPQDPARNFSVPFSTLGGVSRHERERDGTTSPIVGNERQSDTGDTALRNTWEYLAESEPENKRLRGQVPEELSHDPSWTECAVEEAFSEQADAKLATGRPTDDKISKEGKLASHRKEKKKAYHKALRARKRENMAQEN